MRHGLQEALKVEQVSVKENLKSTGMQPCSNKEKLVSNCGNLEQLSIVTVRRD